MWVLILLVDFNSDSDTDSIDTGIDTLGIVDQPEHILLMHGEGICELEQLQ